MLLLLLLMVPLMSDLQHGSKQSSDLTVNLVPLALQHNNLTAVFSCF